MMQTSSRSTPRDLTGDAMAVRRLGQWGQRFQQGQQGPWGRLGEQTQRGQ